MSAPNTKVLHTVGQSVALVDGDTERGVIARVQDKPGGAARESCLQGWGMEENADDAE